MLGVIVQKNKNKISLRQHFFSFLANIVYYMNQGREIGALEECKR